MELPGFDKIFDKLFDMEDNSVTMSQLFELIENLSTQFNSKGCL